MIQLKSSMNILFIWLSLLSLSLIGIIIHVIRNKANFFFVSPTLCVTMKDRLKVTFDTMQVTTPNILIGDSRYPIVVVYQGLLYTFSYINYSNISIEYRNCSDLIICYVCIYIHI
jgi:hypothetical protein